MAKERSVGSVLLTLRERTDLSRNAVARRAGVDPGALYRLETTDRMPNFMLVAKVAKVLGVSLDEIAEAASGGTLPAVQPSEAYVEEALMRISRAASEIVGVMKELDAGRSPSRPRKPARKRT